MPKILIVDDEPDLVEMIADELRDDGWEVGSAGDGVEAVLRVMDGGWDAILMDVRMPRLDGIHALRLIKRLAPRLPVVMFTGQAGRGEMLESARLGAYTCLAKPVATQKLLSVLRQALPAIA
jgi:CheY-like chemotaxis protein